MGKINIKGKYVFTPDSGTKVIKVTLPTIPEYPDVPDQIKYIKISANRTYKLNAVKYMSPAVSAGIVGYGLSSHIKTWIEYLKWPFAPEGYEPTNAIIEWSEEINLHTADIEDFGVPDPEPYQGIAGLQIFNEKGELEVDTSDRLIRYMGSFEITKATGSIRNKGLIGIDKDSLWFTYEFYLRYSNTNNKNFWLTGMKAEDISCIFPDFTVDPVEGSIKWTTVKTPGTQRFITETIWRNFFDPSHESHGNVAAETPLPDFFYTKYFKIIIHYGAY